MKKVITLLSISLVILLFLSCNNKKAKEQNTKAKQDTIVDGGVFINLIHNEKERTRLWKAAIDSGDFKAYNKISVAYIMTGGEVDLYYYSLIMANRYHCPEAYYDMNAILTHQASTREMQLLSNDKDTRNLALYYLFKAKELGFEQAEKEVESGFGKGKSVPNSSYFLKQLARP